MKNQQKNKLASMRSMVQEPKYAQENVDPNLDIIGLLNNFGKQMNNRKNQNMQFQQQISSLSRAYNEAQQKLLETEKLLMNQSVYSDKLRSLIQILKQIINDSIDDDTTLVFIAQLENQTEPKHQIHSQLAQIKHLIDSKKVKSKNNASLAQLKKQILKLQAQKRDLLQDMERVVIENQDLDELKQKLISQVEKCKQQNIRIQESLQKYRQNFEMEKSSLNQKISELKREISRNSQQICGVNLQNAMLLQQKQILSKQLIQVKSQFLQFQGVFGSQKDKKSNKASDPNIQKVDQQYISNLLRNAKNKILKYQQKLKQMSKQNSNEVFIKRQLMMMKQFLSEEALVLFAQLQCERKNERKVQNLDRQLMELAKLEKERNQKLKECEKKVWKYKVRLLRQDQSKNSHSQRGSLSGTINKLSVSEKQDSQGTYTINNDTNQFSSVERKLKSSKRDYDYDCSSGIGKLSQYQE